MAALLYRLGALGPRRRPYDPRMDQVTKHLMLVCVDPNLEPGTGEGSKALALPSSGMTLRGPST
ncbi:hypothetical protein [Streptacidiphilus carbonis]|jgi:hypothetical protein|uniref:hypothetical protein n=1 Tax=Streptacidiphilus carbonis TaxID=105422 RepID=UPI0005A805D1|nr:hypothetical protein [Streptacidiphilus carbonis]